MKDLNEESKSESIEFEEYDLTEYQEEVWR